MKKFITLILIILVSVNLYSLEQEILPLNDKVYDYLDTLYILDNKIPPTAAKPYSISQIKLYLNQINYNELNTVGKKYFSYINKIVNDNNLDLVLDDLASLDVEATSGAELYTHSNTEDIKTFRDWTYNQEDRMPLLKLNLKLNLNDFFFTSADLQYSQGKYETENTPQYYANDTYLYDSSDTFHYNILTNQYNQTFSTSIPAASKYIDFDTPKRAIFSFGGNNWNFNYSKDRLEWGNSTIGNFIYDNHLNNNFINLKIFSKNFNINNTIDFINTQTTSTQSQNDEIKMFLTHRLEFRLSEKFRFAVSENVMYQNTTPLFIYFNPSYIYHNINMREMFNAIASIESDVLLTNKLNWYSQFVLDQATAPNENDSQSASWGASTGLKFTTPINDSDILSISGEALIATPCLYRRDYVDFRTMDRTFVINLNYVVEPSFIGYSEGGDSLAFKIQGKYDRLDKFNFLAYYSLLFKGEIDIFESVNLDGNDLGYANYGSTIFKNGVYSIKHVLYGLMNYQIFKNDHIEISNKTTLSYIYMNILQETPDKYSDIQFSTGLSIKF